MAEETKNNVPENDVPKIAVEESSTTDRDLLKKKEETKPEQKMESEFEHKVHTSELEVEIKHDEKEQKKTSLVEKLNLSDSSSSSNILCFPRSGDVIAGSAGGRPLDMFGPSAGGTTNLLEYASAGTHHQSPPPKYAFKAGDFSRSNHITGGSGGGRPIDFFGPSAGGTTNSKHVDSLVFSKTGSADGRPIDMFGPSAGGTTNWWGKSEERKKITNAEGDAKKEKEKRGLMEKLKDKLPGHVKKPKDASAAATLAPVVAAPVEEKRFQEKNKD